jgi:hypothetical protein
MNQPRSLLDGCPLLQSEPDIWNSLDKPRQEQVLDCLALLLLRHLHETARHAAEECPLRKGGST